MPDISLSGLDFLPSVQLSTTLSNPCSSLILIPSFAVYPNNAVCQTPLVVCGKDNGETLIFSCDFTRRFAKTEALGSPVTALAYGHITSDKIPDLVTITADGQLRLIRIQEDQGIFMHPHHIQLVHANITAAYIADVDKDGVNELVVIMTDRVVRTYQWHKDLRRMLPRFKWEVPCHIAAVAIGQSSLGHREAWLSQPASRPYVSIRFTGDNTTVCESRKESSAMIILPRSHFVRVFGTLISGVYVCTTTIVPPSPNSADKPQLMTHEHRLRSHGNDMVAVSAITRKELSIVATIDVNGLCLLYAYDDRIMTKSEIDPAMRMKFLRDTYNVTLYASGDMIYLAVANNRGKLVNYAIPFVTLEHRYHAMLKRDDEELREVGIEGWRGME